MEKTLREIFQEGPKFEENILKAFENKKLIFFIGAGVSRVMGVQGWVDFSASIIRKAFPKYEEQNTILRDISDSKERITVAYKKFEEENRLEDFYKYFGDGLKPNPNIFNAKENIYEILNRFEAIFLTTNADNLFENVIGSALCHENCDVGIIKSEPHRKLNHLFYLHGHYTDDIDINKNNLVFTAQQYVERYNDENFIGFLRAIFQGDNTIVFVGYGLNEFELIDYIVTKSGYTKKFNKKIYLLYGFCENDDILYNSKKSYFNALNIELIPYDMTRKGYDSLIDFLKLLNEDYNKRAIVPITERISECIKNYSEENYAIIRRFLKDKNLAHTNEMQITSEIKNQRDYNWVSNFYNDGLFSTEQMDEKIEYRAWPLLELFVEWVKSNDEQAQICAVEFLEKITQKQIDSMSKDYTYINKHIIQIVFALNKKWIKAKYIDLIFKISAERRFFYYELADSHSLERVREWNLNLIKKLFDNIFRNVDMDSFSDMETSAIKEFFKKFNSIINGSRLINFVFKYFTELVIHSSDGLFSLFSRIYDVENIYKNDQDYWMISLSEIEYSFTKMKKKTQYSKIKSLLGDNRESSSKLALYLARKYDHNISDLLLDNKTIFNAYYCFHETYLLLKHHAKNGYFEISHQQCLCEVILDSNFGISTKEYVDFLSQKKLLLLQILSNDESKKMVHELLDKGIEPYPSDNEASDCDYIIFSRWENEARINEDIIRDIPLKNWIDK